MISVEMSEGKHSITTSSISKDNCIHCENGKISNNGETSCTL